MSPGHQTVLICVSRDRQRIRNEPRWGLLRSWFPRGAPSAPNPFPQRMEQGALWRTSRAFSTLVALGDRKGALRLEEGRGPLVLRLET